MSWIKLRTNLLSNPKVVRMAGALHVDRLSVIGGLWYVWKTFDQHSVDGVLDGYTLDTMDENLGWIGFCEAMVAVNWLVCTDDRLVMPDFDEHNGKSAKRRAQDAKSKREGREADDDATDDGETSPKRPHGKTPNVGNLSASYADKKRTREREEKEKKKERAVFHSAAVTTPEAVCRALADAGIAGTNPTDALLVALVHAGASVAEFEAAVGKSRGKPAEWAYLLAVVKGRRDDSTAAARAVQQGPAPAPEAPWQETAAGIKRMGESLGLTWREDGWVNGECMSFPVYKQRVLKEAGQGHGQAVEAEVMR